MRLQVLGCSGGIGGATRTTALLLDETALIDCGTGVGDLSLEQLVGIDQVLLTHGHLDHVALLPMLADARAGRRDAPLLVHALPETIVTLKECLFNNRVWPDYTAQPSAERPYVRLQAFAMGESWKIGAGTITPLPVRHAVPAVGFRMDSGAASLVFSGDTTFSEAFWDAVNGIDNLRHVIIETTFLNDNGAGCAHSGHTNARLLAQGLDRLARDATVYITHMEPGREEQTWAEVLAAAGRYRPRPLERGQVIEF